MNNNSGSDAVVSTGPERSGRDALEKDAPWYVRHWPVLAGVCLLLVLTGGMIGVGMARNDHHLVYPMDDTYIHMAVVKNLVHHHIWGISAANGFSSCISSLLYPWLLALCYLIFGVNVWAPLALNVLAGILLLFYASMIVRRHLRSSWAEFLILAAIVVLVPMPALMASGMEHTWQSLICVVFIDLAAQILVRAAPVDSRAHTDWLLLPATIPLIMIRYEGLFIVAVVGLLLLIKRRWGLAVGIGLCAVLPIAAFGAYSLSKGWSFLPNSVLIKGGTSAHGVKEILLSYGRRGLSNLRVFHYFGPYILCVAATFAARVHRRRTLWDWQALLLLITVAVSLQQVFLASLGWGYRYEAYLFASGILGIGLVVAEWFSNGRWPRWRESRLQNVTVSLVLIVAAGQFYRALVSYKFVVGATHNIYDEHFQMGRFIHRFYEGQGVAANDIGAISYYADVRLLDTVGLADHDVLLAKRAQRYGNEELRRLVQRYNVRCIVVYDSWSPTYGLHPPEWVPVGTWTIPNPVVCLPTVAFYAPGMREVPALKNALREFASSLPAGVTQQGPYLGGPPSHVVGAQEPTEDARGRFYPVETMVQFYLDPLSESPAASPDGAAKLFLSFQPGTETEQVDVLLGDELIGSRHFAAGERQRWIDFEVPVQWHPGQNVLRLVGHGQPSPLPPSMREGPFAVREPRWQFDATPTGAIP